MGILSLLAVCVPLILATSSGKDTTCTAVANYGCAKWKLDPKTKLPKRKECIDTNETIGIMPWVAKPAFNTNYTLRTADGSTANDPTSYQPGVLMQLFVRTLDYYSKWRGIIIQGTDVNGTIVGEWEFPADDNNVLHTPCSNKGVALHVSAEIKPFLVRMTWRPPKKNTGTVTFKAVIKQGPANEGYFYWPGSKELTLTEGTGTAPVSSWELAKANTSCASHCKAKSQSCSAATLKGLSSKEKFMQEVGTHRACNYPLLSSCGNPAVDTTSSLCYFYDNAACEAMGIDKADYYENLCESAPRPDQQLLCACGSSGGSSDISAASSASHSPVLLGLLSLLALSASPPSIARRVVLLAVLLALVQGAFAHNWMHTTGRATRQASTQRPCAYRKSSDTHVQIGPGQDFSFKWATGHGGFSWVVLIKGEDYHWLADRDFMKHLDAYVKEAPAGSDTSKTAKGRRYHQSRSDLKTMVGSHFKKAVPYNSTVWHPATAHMKFVYDFNDAKLADDVRVSYSSSKYPWLLSVGKFKHDTDRGGDNDGVNLEIPAGSPPGHYVAHWRWNGYYDCVDVDYRKEKVSEPMKYGNGTGGFVFDRVDHCALVDPQLVLTPLISATEGIESCLDALAKASGSFGKNVAGHGEGTKRIALQTIPTTMPDSVFPAFREINHLPLGDPKKESVLFQSNWLALKGKETQTATNWNQWKAKTDFTANVTCTSILARITGTLKDAVARCAHANCKGIAYPNAGGPKDPDGTYLYQLCKATTTKKDTRYEVAFKKAVPAPTVKKGEIIKISFSRAMDKIPAGGGFLMDTGLEFGDKTGSKWKYGWLCNVTGKRNGGVFGTDKTYDKAYQHVVLQTCDKVADENKRNRWSIVVPNGVYNVTHRFINYGRPVGCTAPKNCKDVNTENCVIENIRINPRSYRNLLQDEYIDTTTVEVLDGKLTLSGGYNDYGVPRLTCQYLSSLTIQRVADALSPVWLPSSKNPWFQTELPAAAEVGYVYLTDPLGSFLDTPGNKGSGWPMPYTNMDSRNYCDGWHVFKSDRCYPDVPADLFEGPNSGAVVGVSNSPCSGGTCTGTKCGKVEISWTQNRHEPATGVRGRPMLGRPFVDCKGARGKYLWVQLPGSNRILNFRPQFSRAKSALPKDSLLCYGGVPRYPTELLPEYITTNDPEDPVFYSTCYIREFDKSWEFPLAGSPPPKDWRFSGQCIDCPSFVAGDSTFTTAELKVTQPPKWTITDQCINCKYNRPTFKEPFSLKAADSSCDLSVCDKADVDCLKTLLTQDGRAPISAGQCATIAAGRAECSSTFVFTPAKKICSCWIKSSCCKTCTFKSKVAGSNVYELNN